MLITISDKWAKLLENSSIKRNFYQWLENDEDISFHIKNERFINLGLRPGKMIPQYSKETLPKILRTYELEILRIGKGECVLTKTGSCWGRPSLFPDLPSTESKQLINTIKDIPSDSVLRNKNLSREDMGIIIATRAGFLDSFITRNLDISSKLHYCGRLRTSFNGQILLNEEEIHIGNTQIECDAIFETENKLIVVEAKNKLQKSFSIHQIAFPTILLKQCYPKKEIYGLYLQYNIEDIWLFQFFLVEIPFKENQTLDILSYNFLNSKEILIGTNQRIL